MPNLAKSQAQFTALFREFICYLRLWRISDAVANRFKKGRTRVYELNEGANIASLWTFSGAKRGTNVSDDGRLWVTITDETPGAGQARTQVWMDSAKTLLVAQGDAADGATATLAAQNSSGLTGTVKLGTVAATDSDIVLALDIDEPQKAKDHFDLATDGGVAAFKGILARIDSIYTAVRGQATAAKSDLEQKFIGTKLAEFLSSSARTVISATEAEDANGDVQITLSGILADLIDAMADNTVAQTVAQNTVAAGSPAADPDNVGVGTLTVVATRQHAPAGKLIVECLTGKDTTLSETFRVTLLRSIDNALLTGRLNLKTKKEWESQDLGVRLLLTRSITDTQDGATQLSTYVINGETLENTNAGLLYFELAAGSYTGGNTHRVRAYADAAKSFLVMEGFRASASGTITLEEKNNSGLTGSVLIAYTGDDTDIIVNLNPWKKGDVITVDITNDRLGLLQTMFADLWHVSLPSTAAGSATIKDDHVREALDHLVSVS